ncbi:hypothetical protein D5S17_07730 [Pseudonocardiaceae bacterium YIM PH 21723]|nr:hypothetical protein D5S17_07730 [Pseudonocardiaceae bacterium YIM PH 21723]
MSKVRVSGFVLLLSAVLVFAVNRLARSLFPDQWGGPNIGGGLIELATYPVAGIGVVLLAVSLIRGR